MAITAEKESSINQNRRAKDQREAIIEHNPFRIEIDTVRITFDSLHLYDFINAGAFVTEVIKDKTKFSNYFVSHGVSGAEIENKHLMAHYGSEYNNLFEARIHLDSDFSSKVFAKVTINRNEFAQKIANIELYGLMQYEKSGTISIKSLNKRILLNKILKCNDVVPLNVAGFDISLDTNVSMLEVLKSDILLAFTHKGAKGRVPYVYNWQNITHLKQVETLYFQKSPKASKMPIKVYDKTECNNLDVTITRIEATIKGSNQYPREASILLHQLRVLGLEQLKLIDSGSEVVSELYEEQ